MEHSSRPRRWRQALLRPKRLLTISIVIVLAGTLGTIVHILTAPVHGRVVTSPQDVKLTTPKKAPQPVATSLASNSYISLDLPVGFSQQASSSVPAGLLYSTTSLKQSLQGSQIVTIAIKALPAGGLAGDSSYQLRTSQPTNYRASNLTAQGEPVILMTNLTADGIVAFWSHHSFEATISVTTGLGDGGSAEQAAEQTTLAQVLNGWRWLQ